MEKLTAPLKRTIVCVCKLRAVRADDWQDIGEFLRCRFARAQRVFGLQDEAEAAAANDAAN